MPINDGFVIAYSPSGQKRRVPEHYLSNKSLGYKLAPSRRPQKARVEPEKKEPQTPDPAPTPTPQKEND